MLWHTEPTPQEFGALYVSGEWRIRHYMERDEHGRGTLGFGIPCARLYRDAVQVALFTGPNALDLCQQWAAEREVRAA